MTELSFENPEVGKPDKTEEPKIPTAFTKIKEVVNGKLNSGNIEAKGIATSNLADESVTEGKLSEAVRNKLSAPSSAHSEIATEQNRENAAYGKLGTPDEVEIVVPAHGLTLIWFTAQWKCSSTGNARAALFIGANQLKVASSKGVASTQAAIDEPAGINPEIFRTLTTCPVGLASYGGANATGDVTTGQAVGFVPAGGSYGLEINGEIINTNTADIAAIGFGGACAIFGLAAATYAFSVQFKSSAGNVKVKNRKLFAESRSF
jgi:hypothetical protein